MFAKSDGTTTYATRDLATIRYRMRTWNPVKIIYEVSVEQELHFKQVFAAAYELKLVDESVELFHTNHGWYLGPDGKKFSTRAGKTVRLEEVLEEAIDRAKKFGSPDAETAKQVGVGAIKYFDLMRAVRTDVVFDWEKVMNMDGNSGPYLQYTFARTQSVLRKTDDNRPMTNDEEQSKKSSVVSHKLNDEELSVLRLLPKFSEVVEDAAMNYSPNLLCNYLYDLAQRYNAFYNKHRILEAEDGQKEFRLALTQATGTVLKNGLSLLGIEAPVKM
jgi:arginyl-tRNA synthetase